MEETTGNLQLLNVFIFRETPPYLWTGSIILGYKLLPIGNATVLQKKRQRVRSRFLKKQYSFIFFLSKVTNNEIKEAKNGCESKRWLTCVLFLISYRYCVNLREQQIPSSRNGAKVSWLVTATAALWPVPFLEVIDLPRIVEFRTSELRFWFNWAIPRIELKYCSFFSELFEIGASRIPSAPLTGNDIGWLLKSRKASKSIT